MKNIVKKGKSFELKVACLFLWGVIFLSGCGGSSSTEFPAAPPEAPRNLVISGFAQKGPLQKGSAVEIYELDGDFNQTGVAYRTKIQNDYGEYQLSVRLGSRYIELFGEGYYFDEISAERSEGWIALNGLADTYKSPSININLLTTLAKSRILALIEMGRNLEQANTEAHREVMEAFGITDQIKTPSEQLNIFGNSSDDAKLLTITVILLQMAHQISETTPSAALSELIETIGNDLLDNGRIDETKLKSEIAKAILTISPIDIQEQMVAKFPEMEIPEFEDVISKIISENAYIDSKKFLVTLTCASNCADYTDLFFTKLIEYNEFLLTVLYSEDLIIGDCGIDSYGRAWGQISGSINNTNNSFYISLAPRSDPNSVYCLFNGSGLISDTNRLTGLITSSQSACYGAQFELSGYEVKE